MLSETTPHPCPSPMPAHAATRLRVDVINTQGTNGQLAADVRRGLQQSQKRLPAKYFYDDRGSALFDAICDAPEYYLTRTGQALLEDSVADIVATASPQELVELGSGASRKTRVLLGALSPAATDFRYVPMDVSEGMLRQASAGLLREYPWLKIHGVVGDYERHMPYLPDGRGRLVLFLGSTIGNFGPAQTASFLANLRAQLEAGEHFLLGVDLVKPAEVLEAAYNDAAGLTAEFNRNVLHVINRELDADFDPEEFDHLAFFNEEESQIEMHLRACREQRVRIGKLGMESHFRAGETIHTEISRKFTRNTVEDMLGEAGFALQRWYTPENDYFALALARAI